MQAYSLLVPTHTEAVATKLMSLRGPCLYTYYLYTHAHAPLVIIASVPIKIIGIHLGIIWLLAHHEAGPHLHQ